MFKRIFHSQTENEETAILYEEESFINTPAVNLQVTMQILDGLKHTVIYCDVHEVFEGYLERGRGTEILRGSRGQVDWRGQFRWNLLTRPATGHRSHPELDARPPLVSLYAHTITLDCFPRDHSQILRDSARNQFLGLGPLKRSPSPQAPIRAETGGIPYQAPLRFSMGSPAPLPSVDLYSTLHHNTAGLPAPTTPTLLQLNLP